ncbi:HCLS1-binding protein 3 [Sphaerodactylus townsendi]|uniref:HCLS1-binding protein 3 n=1 Tax=Sphaerodactylus townsendi TaxID=933632 RepID=UPI00202622C6|nr:HCLS1-binding protein 3 [Sphaerodactylus townsendi]
MQQSPARAVLVTTRPVQNAHTGLDLSVPEYQEIRGKMMSGHVEYNIVVVTQLAAFKSSKHKREDVIQFMVSKKYSEIEEFYQKLVTCYPQSSLPPLPRKVLFVGESDIRERRVMFNEIMKAIAKEADLATSPELLEFLGTRSAGGVDFKGKNLPDKEEEDNEAFDFFREKGVPDIVPQFESLKERDIKSAKEEEDEEEDGDIDPLGVIKSKKTKKPLPSLVRENKSKLTIFDEEMDPDEELFSSAKDFSFTGNKRILSAKENLKLFEDPDLGGTVMLGDSLLLPTACVKREHDLPSTLDEDTSKLLSVEEDFEKMWNFSAKPKPKPKPKPQVPPKPAIPKKPTTSSKVPVSTAPKAKPAEAKVQSMAEVDILKYIQENESLGSEEPTLF